MKITDLLSLSHVPRWSNVRHSPPQTVADHSFRVACIYLELCDRLGKEPSLRGLTFAMCHDGMEAYTGDIPGDFKREIKSQVAEIEKKMGVVFCDPPIESERRIVKLADRIETYTFIVNHGVGPHADRIKAMIRAELEGDAGEWWPTVRMLVHDIIEEAGRN